MAGNSVPGSAWTRLTDAIHALSVPASSGVLVAISGGPDSVALALAFHDVSAHPGKAWRLRLGHVNHALRDRESEADEAFVQELGAQLGLEVSTMRIDPASHAAEHRLSIETAARDLRYAALAGMLAEWEGEYIALGHHADDQAETVLLNLLRGAGLDGLCGMSARSGMLLRPFLALTKGSIKDALDERGARYRVDSSNMDVSARRNFIRHRVLPIVAEVSPRAAETIARNARLLQDDVRYLREETSRALEGMNVQLEDGHAHAHVGAFRTLPPALQGRVIRLLVAGVRGDTRDLTERHVRLITDVLAGLQPSRNLGTQLPDGVRLEFEGASFHLYRVDGATRPLPRPADVTLSGEVGTDFGIFSSTVEDIDDSSQIQTDLAVCGPYNAWFDVERLGATVRVRSRLPGDRVRLVNARGTRKLQDLLVDARIPQDRRDRVPVVENAGGIVWIPGIGVSGRAAVGPRSRRVAHLRFRPFI